MSLRATVARLTREAARRSTTSPLTPAEADRIAARLFGPDPPGLEGFTDEEIAHAAELARRVFGGECALHAQLRAAGTPIAPGPPRA